MRKVLTWFIILGLIAGGIGAYLWWRNAQATKTQSQGILRTAEVTRGDLLLTVVASGNVAVNKKIELRFDTAGIVGHVNVKVNQRVRAGEELAALTTTELERAVQQARIALEQATLNRDILARPTASEDVELARLNVQNAAQALEVARLGKQTAQTDANAMLVQAQRDRENAYSDYSHSEGTDAAESKRKRYENAVEQERIAKLNAEVMLKQAQAQWVAAYNRYQQALENLHTLEKGPDEQQLHQAALQIEQAQLNLEQAQARLDSARLVAPFEGLITAVNVQQGFQTYPSTAAFTLIDDSQFYVDVLVDEVDIGKVRVGQAVDVTLDAYPQITLPGEVESIAPAALNVGGIISYRLRVRLLSPAVSPTNDEKGQDKNGYTIRDGMTASVVIHTDRVTDILLVPNWAIRTDQSSGEITSYCYVLRADGVPERRPITRGRYNDTFSEVLSGINEGETVALVTEERTQLSFSVFER